MASEKSLRKSTFGRVRSKTFARSKGRDVGSRIIQ